MALQRWGDRFGTFDPAAPGQPSGFDSYTWANRPAAASYTGRVIRITDVGPAAGSLFISDGTYWVPLNGYVTLAARAELGLFTTATAMSAIAGWSLVIPAGLFRKPGSFLRGSFKARRTGTLGASSQARLNVGWSTSDLNHLVAGFASGTSPKAVYGFGVISRVNDTQVRNTGVDGVYGNVGEINDTAISSLNSFSAISDTTLMFYGVLTNPGVGEAIAVDEVIVELITP